MYTDGRKVFGEKGYMALSDLQDDLKFFDEEDLLVVHFRKATHGAVDGTASHPFPITADEAMLKRLSWESPWGIAHNGILAGFGGHKNSELSDTQDFIKRVLSNGVHLLRDQAYLEMLSLIGSKFLLLDGAGQTTMIGAFIQHEGAYFSNSDFKAACAWSQYAWPGFGKKAWRGYRVKGAFLCPHFDDIDVNDCLECEFYDWEEVMCSFDCESMERAAEEKRADNVHYEEYDDVSWEDLQPGNHGRLKVGLS